MYSTTFRAYCPHLMLAFWYPLLHHTPAWLAEAHQRAKNLIEISLEIILFAQGWNWTTCRWQRPQMSEQSLTENLQSLEQNFWWKTGIFSPYKVSLAKYETSNSINTTMACCRFLFKFTNSQTNSRHMRFFLKSIDGPQSQIYILLHLRKLSLLMRWNWLNFSEQVPRRDSRHTYM